MADGQYSYVRRKSWRAFLTRAEELGRMPTADVSFLVFCAAMQTLRIAIAILALGNADTYSPQTFDYEYDVKLPMSLKRAELSLHVDQGTRTFLHRCQDRFHSPLPRISDTVSLALLRPFLSTTSVNGLVGRGRMFILSHKQFSTLLTRKLPLPDDGRMLDIGAGDGGVTSEFASLFDQVEVTETNPFMRWRLWYNGFKTVHDESSWLEQGSYDLISCLNVLDRCAYPQRLLEQMYRKLKPDGLLLLALVLPYSPWIDDPKYGRGLRPEGALPVRGRGFEEQAASLVMDVLEPMGFEVETAVRAPYFCEGDMNKPWYILHDIVIVARKRN
eukprot:TRINITY_DN8737_c1_g1_i1.p1 TRINITY_DN8737_c1_g1~~TRINITY_DN8737_c1_g1_i1.p1  ORF type:complete len:330 (+),score=8.95 TRINITY_DN8737_c1_g1_i1:53-1042(+)